LTASLQVGSIRLGPSLELLGRLYHRRAREGLVNMKSFFLFSHQTCRIHILRRNSWYYFLLNFKIHLFIFTFSICLQTSEPGESVREFIQLLCVLAMKICQFRKRVFVFGPSHVVVSQQPRLQTKKKHYHDYYIFCSTCLAVP
jgi:hypothetical protein